MNKELLNKHIKNYINRIKLDKEKEKHDLEERNLRSSYYRSWTQEKILSMNAQDLYEYMSKLWAMLIWGNKQYVVDWVIDTNSFEKTKKELANLVWGSEPIVKRWNHFRDSIKGFGPAMISEILSHSHPRECMVWNRRAYVAFNYLGVSDLPRYDYQITGEKYEKLSQVAKEILKELTAAGVKNGNLLTVDYFIWDELQVEENLSRIHDKTVKAEEIKDQKIINFIHDEIKEKIAEIGRLLGFSSRMEVKVADGSVVDATWEATIGNMGRVIYVFEVQTKGSIDSLILNLMKSLNNPAVQGIVAVSDIKQLEEVRKNVITLEPLSKKLKYWNYEEVLEVHENLEKVNESINRLDLVPKGF